VNGRSTVMRPWMRTVLRAAGWYNLVWGAFVVVFPLVPFRWAGMEEPRYPEIWQCLGMVIAVYGIAYLFAAHDPRRYWPIVLVGLLGKLFGPIGFFIAALGGRLPWVAGWTILTNDLIWWVPFVLILYAVYRDSLEEGNTTLSPEEFAATLERTRSHDGRSLAELSRAAPLLVIFLRHLG